MSDDGPTKGLERIYGLTTLSEAIDLYATWATDYDDELSAAGYQAPLRCAEALSAHAALPWAPLAEFGCGTGMGGLALHQAGFECLDGYDVSPAMLEKAAEKDIYRNLAPIDLSQPLPEALAETYQNAAAIGVLNPAFMPATAIDQILGILPAGGCFVFSLNQNALDEGSMEMRVLELTENLYAEILFKEQAAQFSETDLISTVYVLKKR